MFMRNIGRLYVLETLFYILQVPLSYLYHHLSSALILLIVMLPNQTKNTTKKINKKNLHTHKVDTVHVYFSKKMKDKLKFFNIVI